MVNNLLKLLCPVILAILALFLSNIYSQDLYPKFSREVLEKKEGSGYCRPGGLINDSCCDFKTVEDINSDVLPTVHELLSTPFFSHYKINLQRSCPFWNSNDLCSKVDCTVSTLEEAEAPESWQSPEKMGSLDLGLGSLNLKKFERCTYTNKDFCVLEDEESSDGVIVNLLKNPERFTGYAGDSAAKVWKTLYEENCFGFLKDPESSEASPFLLTQDSLASLCTEKRVFYRVLSGLHASISTHICDKYFNSTSGQWEQNLDCFITRVGSFPDRLENMYFNYVLLLRAVTKVSKYLENYSYCSTDLEQNKTIKKLLKELSARTKACPETFDEKQLFQGEDANVLKDQFKEHFRNITRVMDCIGCQKCRLWGKIQTGGIGTALKILFSYEAKSLNPKRNPNLFQKTEIVALFNAFGRVSESIDAVEKFRELYRLRQEKEESHKTPHPDPKATQGLQSQLLSVWHSCQQTTRHHTRQTVHSLLRWLELFCQQIPGLEVYRKLVAKAFFPLGFIAV